MIQQIQKKNSNGNGGISIEGEKVEEVFETRHEGIPIKVNTRIEVYRLEMSFIR